MKILSVTDPEFKPYGRVVTGLDAAKAEILAALVNTPLPDGTDYVAEDERLQELPAARVRWRKSSGSMTSIDLYA